MANEYLVAIHSYISDKIAAAEKNKKTAEQQNDLTSLHYWQGQLQELETIRQYLAEKIDLKTQKYF
ncbi:MAG: hypothetical protein JSW26_06650 [Desulfobacterales bacterium]|nr:MAG: hypothetical protein JSW26_06650 [Desulfobacterales bacterium]